ncbi:histidine kinase [Nocardia sp. NPDC006630]|uniref:sensor histidine kinase n=1 Tax=Nocardia sp. NPDC006630 TaxID=3157181 RepID=UPI0033AF249A
MIVATFTGATTGLTRLFRLVGLIAVVLGSVDAVSWHPLWVSVLIVLSWIGWAGWVTAPADASNRALSIERISLCAMAIGGGATAAQSNGSMITALATVLGATALLSKPAWFGYGLAALTVVLMFVSSLVVAGERPRSLLGLLTGVVVLALMGWARRQTRIAAEQNRLLVEQNRVIRAERDRAAAMAERGRIARDIHDVLAHTLGGLVMQLDAADALLEAGAVEQAAERVKASHTLAVSGLADARRVVGALRAEGSDLTTELRRLAGEHRATGGEVQVEIDAATGRASEQVEMAVSRVVQEALTNARKHAPAQPVTLTAQGSATEVELVISNVLSAQGGSLRHSGSGAGLLGMRERIAAIGGTVQAGREEGRWTVRIRAPRR